MHIRCELWQLKEKLQWPPHHGHNPPDLHIPFLWYLSATRRDVIISFPWRVLHMARWAQVKGKLLVESARVWFCDVYEVRSCTAPIILQLSALLRNTRDLPHDIFLDTLSPHKMSLFLYLSKRLQLVQPVRKWMLRCSQHIQISSFNTNWWY